MSNEIKNKPYKYNVNILGDGNSVSFGDRCRDTANICIWGSDNIVEFGNDCGFTGTVYVGLPDCPVKNCKFTFNDNSAAAGLTVYIAEDSSGVIIGKDCMFSDDIEIWASDTHSITDLNGKLLNYAGLVIIGNHVFIGKHSRVMKNSVISDNSVVGLGSVVTSKFSEPNVVIAGNPAKCVKHGVNWNCLRPNLYNIKVI